MPTVNSASSCSKKEYRILASLDNHMINRDENETESKK